MPARCDKVGPMEQNYWLGRWERGETGWHQDEAEPRLIEAFSDLGPTRVLVPLCGKSRDLAWLASRGHEVIGVELSERACRAFFEENKIPFSVTPEGRFTAYRGERITILNGNIFDLGPEELGEFGALYDRAALIALPPETRTRYAAHLLELIRKRGKKRDFRFLQIILYRSPEDREGPPFSVSEAEVKRFYGSDFEITQTSREQFPMGEEIVLRLSARE